MAKCRHSFFSTFGPETKEKQNLLWLEAFKWWLGWSHLVVIKKLAPYQKYSEISRSDEKFPRAMIFLVPFASHKTYIRNIMLHVVNSEYGSHMCSGHLQACPSFSFFKWCSKVQVATCNLKFLMLSLLFINLFWVGKGNLQRKKREVESLPGKWSMQTSLILQMEN